MGIQELPVNTERPLLLDKNTTVRLTFPDSDIGTGNFNNTDYPNFILKDLDP